MSHFTVLITKTNEKPIEEQLAPFDEDLELPNHIDTSRADFIEKGRKDVEYAKKKIAEYDADPEAYRGSTSNKAHLKWLTGKAREIAKISDEEALFNLGSEWYKNELDEEGNYWSTSNNNAKWDWYSIGGRWAGFFMVKSGASGIKGHHRAKDFAAITGEEVEELPEAAADVCKVKDIDWEAMDTREKRRRGEYYDEQMAKPEKERFIWDDNREQTLGMSRAEYIDQPIYHSTFALLHDGKWYERGGMGWWAAVSNDKGKDAWDEEWRKLVDSLDPDTEVAIVDCHI